MSVLRYDIADRVATITLDRPKQRNALSSELLAAIAGALATADTAADVDVIVLTGADPAFCAGLDLGELADSGANLGPAPVDGPLSPFPAVSKPLIGAVNGVAATGGLELALHCDVLVASERARFADTHVRVGVHPAWGMTVLLPQRIGFQRARLMGLTGDFLDAAGALAAGLVAEVVPHEQLLPRCLEIAAAIAENDPEVVRTILATERAVAASVWGEGLRVEAAAAAANRTGVFDTARVGERVAAVLARGRSQSR